MRHSFRLLLLAACAANLFGTRLYAQSNVLLQLRSGSPAADRLVVDSAGGLLAGGTLNIGTIPATGAGSRLMWYPRKAAFRAGHVIGTQWDDASVGLHSTAMGYATTASGNRSIAMGTDNTASGYASIAMGTNTTASGDNSTAMGFATTASGLLSTAMGRSASTNGQIGAFVYGDNSTSTVMNASVANQFSVRAAGGYRLFTNSALTAGMTLSAGGSTWSAVSDVHRKEHFREVDGEDLLQRLRLVPVSTWRYKDEEDRTVRHIGPMAQDWHRVFDFGGDPLRINMGDMDGVNLAAVQALERRTGAQAERIRALEAEVARIGPLEAQNAALQQGIAGLRGENAALRQEAAAMRARLERIEVMLGSR